MKNRGGKERRVELREGKKGMGGEGGRAPGNVMRLDEVLTLEKCNIFISIVLKICD